VAITLVIVWIIGPGFNMAYMTPSAKITDAGDCTVYSEWPDKTTQKAVGVFTVFLQFILPLIMLAYGYTRMALVLHRRVETAEAPAAGLLRRLKPLSHIPGQTPDHPGKYERGVK